MVDWKKLEDEVDCAIIKQDASCVKFEPLKTLMECKYQQKYAKDKLLNRERVFNIVIFVAAIGLPLLTIGLYEKKGDELFAGIMIVIFALTLNYFLIGNKFRVYSKIILDAEKRILSEGIAEPKQSQEANTPPQAQEKQS